MHRIRLRIDEDHHRLLARDEQSAVAWEVGTDGTALATGFNWKALRGIVFVQRERAAQFGLKVEDGCLRFGEHYSFKFNVKELRAPILSVAQDSGWDFRPVLAFNRFFGG
jgi:hypothetical protein